MKVAMACGGTGGHIFPGLATAQVLKERGHEVTLWLAGKDIENEAVRAWEGARHTVKADGFQYGFSVKTLKTAYGLFVRAGGECRQIMEEDRPDVILGMGSYACVGPIYAARKLKVPVVLHESNVIPGKAIKWLSRRATSVAACFEETRHYLPKVELTVTGMPLRPELVALSLEEKAARHVGGAFTVLVMGGSRGSQALNQVVREALMGLRELNVSIGVIHLTGPMHYDAVKLAYKMLKLDVDVRSFESNMGRIYQETDLAISRSGSASCAELLAFNVPSLLVPYPFATHDHQTMNAKAMERMGVADVVAEGDLESAWLAEYLDGCLHTPGRLERMSAAADGRLPKNAAELLADELERVADLGADEGL